MTSELTRRSVLKGALGAGVALAAGGGSVVGSLARNDRAGGAIAGGVPLFVEPLPIPPVIDLTGGGGATLSAANSTHRFHSALGAAPTFGYGGASYLGPTIVAREGVPVSVTFRNALGSHPLAASVDPALLIGSSTSDRTAPRIATHLHGGNVPPGADGGPLDTFTPGQQRTYNYPNTQDGTTLWYHDHALGITRLNVAAGLAGFYLLRATGEEQLGIPVGAPYEVPIVLQDRSFNPDGSIAYPPAPWEPEYFGDTPVVNGKIAPNLQVDRTLYRFRLLNGSNARFYNLSFSVPLRWWLIGSDGGFLNSPVPLTTLLMAPGERCDVLVDFSQQKSNKKIGLLNDAVVPFPAGSRGSLPIPQVMQFTTTAGASLPRSVPATLRPNNQIPAPPAANVVARTRDMTLVEVVGRMSRGGKKMPLMAMLNGKMFLDPVTEIAQSGTWEQWNLINTTGDNHPIHLHFTQFRLLNRQSYDVARYMRAYDGTAFPPPSAAPYLTGAAVGPGPVEAGWKDTIQAPPGQVTRILVPFGAGAGGVTTAIHGSYTGDYVWHCHILEHEDNDMMRPLRITT